MNKKAKIAIILPTLNQGDELLITAVDPIVKQLRHIEQFIIIDNGQQDIKINAAKCVTLVTKQNLGVAGSWNLGIKYAFEQNPDITHVLACQDDCAFSDTQIPEIIDVLSCNPDKWFLVGPYFWSVWAISREGAAAMEYDKNRIFDDKFFPAYFEDNDFHWRLRQIDELKYMGSVSIMTPSICVNSATVKKDPSLNKYFDTNKAYYLQKWGGEPSREVYTKAFNKQ